MAKPPILQQLTKGKFLCAKNFPSFAETFNYTVARIENLKGDKDANPMNGRISVDVTDPEHPIIRYTDPAAAKNNLVQMDEVCAIDWTHNTITNVYVQVEQMIYTSADLTFTPVSNGYLFLLVDVTGNITSATAESISDYNSLYAADITKHVVPICYMADDTYGHRRVVDLRQIPHAQSWLGVSPI